MSEVDCSGKPCIEGTCSPGGGMCEAGITYGDATIDQCISATCCMELAACTNNYTAVDPCLDCLNNGGGPECDAFLTCSDPCFGVICNSGLSTTDVDLGDCLSVNCCSEFNACTSNGTNLEACADCIYSDPGVGSICDPALTCAQMYCSQFAG